MKKIFLLMITIVFIFLGINIVSADSYHQCGITTDDELKCWGSNTSGQTNIPSGYNFKKVNVGGNHTCGITTDDELKCWGSNTSGQINVPSGYKWKQFSLGGGFTCGITLENQLKCWGDNSYGQLNIPNGYDWIRVELGLYHTCGITSGYNLRCWGYNKFGQTGLAYNMYWNDLSLGGINSCGITGGYIYCKGSNSAGQTNIPSGYNFKSVNTGFYIVCGITIDDDLKCWGDEYYGQTNIPIGYKWKEVNNLYSNTCGITKDNELKCWGDNSNGQLDFPTGYKWKSFTENIEIQEPIQIPTPTNLKQYIQSPLLEREEIQVGSKIGKFQSGSGVILEAAIQNDTTNSYNMIFEVYRQGQTTPLYDYSIEITSGTGQITLPYLGVGDFIWKIKTTDNNGNTSEVVDYSTNQAWEIDFSIFEGFEPYPYGFNFVNATPDISELTGGISGKDGFFKDTREKNPGTKWEIMDMVFPIESFNGDEREYFAAFESLGLNNDKPTIFSDGICFGLGVSALTQYHKPEILRRNFPVFSNNIGTGYIFDKINIQNDINNNYQLMGLDDNLKSILALQLYQKETSFDNKMILSLENDTPIDILNKVKNNPGKYILNFKGKTGCNLFGKSCTDVGHTVIPYKAEGNKIYIWDNNVPFPFFEKTIGLKFYGNKQYIEIDTINNKFNVPFYNRDKFEKIGIVSIDEAFVDNTSLIGFNDIDTLYTLNGNSDILLTDTNGNKTGYKNGEIYEEIPGTRIVVNYAGDTTDNTWKQIYLPQKLENLTIEINGKIDENYDLMIAGGDYYTKLEGITTSSGQTDIFNISRENIKIDLDDTKTNSGTYNILVDDFQNNSTGTVMLGNLETINGKQELDINWTEVLNNSDTAVIYSKDLDNDGIQETIENLKPILDYSIEPEPEILLGNISGKIGLYLPQEICKKIGNKNCSQIVKQLEKEILNKTTKLVLEKQEEGEEEIEGNNKNKEKNKKQNKKGKDKNKEEKQYIELDNKGNYKIVDLEPGMYKLSLELKKGWTTKTPQTGYYMLEITPGENYVDKDFQVINKLLEQLIKNLKNK